MPRPTSRSDSANGHFKVRTPVDILHRARGLRVIVDLPAAGADPGHVAFSVIGDHVRFSLKSRSPAIIRQRHAIALAKLESLWDQLRKGPPPLSQIRISALAGVAYRLFIDHFEANPGDHDTWAAVKAFSRAAREGRITDPPILLLENIDQHRNLAAIFGTDLTAGVNALAPIADRAAAALEERYGFVCDWTLARAGDVADAESRIRLIYAIDDAVVQAAWQLKRNAQGDYTPDPRSNRFATLERSRPAGKTGSTDPMVGFKQLFTAYSNVPSKFGKRRPKTLSDYERMWLAFAIHVIADRAIADPLAVTTADVAAWRDHLLANGLAPKTIASKHLASIKAVYQRQMDDGALVSNPVGGRLMPTARKGTQSREAGFSDDEARTILLKARDAPRGRLAAHTHRAIRWAPWICAYTGARIAEVCQLRKQDFHLSTDGWTVLITPDAGSTKTDTARTIPIHTALVTEGLINFINSLPGPYLFIQNTGVRSEAAKRAATSAQRIGQFVRQDAKIGDARLQPNHGWRHRFTTRARAAGLDAEKREYILGHALSGVAAQYGDMAGLREWMNEYPREV